MPEPRVDKRPRSIRLPFKLKCCNQPLEIVKSSMRDFARLDDTVPTDRGLKVREPQPVSLHEPAPEIRIARMIPHEARP